jgi:hypothetical protein
MEGSDKEEIARALAREYGISEKEALEAADRFEERMRQAGILEEEDGWSTTPPIHHEWMGLAGEGSPFSVSPVDQPQPR